MPIPQSQVSLKQRHARGKKAASPLSLLEMKTQKCAGQVHNMLGLFQEKVAQTEGWKLSLNRLTRLGPATFRYFLDDSCLTIEML